MADEPVIADPVEPVEPVEPTEPEPTPHPLSESGARFREVYGKFRDAERDNVALRERLNRLEVAVSTAQAQPATQPPRHFTPKELQRMVDQGALEPMEAAAVVAEQARQTGEQAMEARLVEREKAGRALAEVNTYIERIPALRHPKSADFTKVLRAAQEVAEDMGLSVQDYRVQRRALREAFGSLSNVTGTRQAREGERRAADTHVEYGRGGGTGDEARDPLRGIPKEQIEYWERKGYDRKEMLEEAKFYTPKKKFGGR